jgi:hypothetical protein
VRHGHGQAPKEGRVIVVIWRRRRIRFRAVRTFCGQVIFVNWSLPAIRVGRSS